MGKGSRICVLFSWFCLSGCSFYRYAFNNTCFEIDRALDNSHDEKQRHHEARAAWIQYAGRCAVDRRESADFKHGFLQGYEDFLVYGGSGEPPLTPPHHYWKTCFKTASGHAAIDSWNDGFRAGAEVARQEGRHEWRVLPGVRPLVDPPPPALHRAQTTAEKELPEPRIAPSETREGTPR